MLEKILKGAFTAVLVSAMGYAGFDIVKKISTPQSLGANPETYRRMLKQINEKDKKNVCEEYRFQSENLSVIFHQKGFVVSVNKFGYFFDFIDIKDIEKKPSTTRYSYIHNYQNNNVLRQQVIIELLGCSTFLQDSDGNNTVDVINVLQDSEQNQYESKTKLIWRNIDYEEDADKKRFKKSDKFLSIVKTGFYTEEFMQAWKDFYIKK